VSYIRKLYLCAATLSFVCRSLYSLFVLSVLSPQPRIEFSDELRISSRKSVVVWINLIAAYERDRKVMVQLRLKSMQQLARILDSTANKIGFVQMSQDARNASNIWIMLAP
jgi:hypothetical protein